MTSCARMIPIVVASWNMMLKAPRRCAGDISFKKRGTAWLANPTPTPSETRPSTSVTSAAEPKVEVVEVALLFSSPAQEVMAAPTRKAMPATSIEALRPHLGSERSGGGKKKKKKKKKEEGGRNEVGTERERGETG